jgi:hypothetical protein
MMRSASSSASSTSLVTSTTVFFSSRQIASISSCSFARVSASSADSGSSSSRNSGLMRERARHRDALAHAARELGRAAIRRVAEPDHAHVFVRAGESLLLWSLCENTVSTASATFSNTVSHGISE